MVDNTDSLIMEARTRLSTIAAPHTVDLIARLADALEQERDEVERLRANECTRQHLRVEDVERAEKAEARVNELDRTLEATIDERDRLRDEVERLLAVQREDYEGIYAMVAERDRLRAAVDAVRALADGPETRILFTDIRAVLDEHLGGSDG